MGLLGEDKAFTLDYSGRGCGGANLPFDTVEAALAYAASRYATEARVEERASGLVRTYRRRIARGRLVEVTE